MTESPGEQRPFVVELRLEVRGDTAEAFRARWEFAVDRASRLSRRREFLLATPSLEVCDSTESETLLLRWVEVHATDRVAAVGQAEGWREWLLAFLPGVDVQIVEAHAYEQNH